MHYLELTLIENDKSLYKSWTLLFNQLHLSLTDFHNMGIDSIGIAFPNYQFKVLDNKTISTLGNKLRIFSNEDLLKIFVNDLKNRLDKYYPNWQDDIHIKAIKPIPENHSYAIYTRHYKKNIAKIAKEFAEHKNISFDDALAHCQTHKVIDDKPYPFVKLKSASTNQTFYLHIIKEASDKNIKGKFGVYGLGQGASVPEF